MEQAYDIVIIGSGFGGAITGCRLAQAGQSVCILERGRRWAKEEFPRTTGQVAKAFWEPRQTHGFVEYRAFKRIDVIQGCGVGGGSLHYFNVHLRTPAAILQQPAWPADVTRSVLDPYYDLVKGMLEAVPLAPPVGRQLPPKTNAFLAAAQGAGKTAELVDIAVYTGPDRETSHGGYSQNACVYCGNCMLGCHVHAKNTLDLNYIPLAEKHGAQVYPLHSVDKIAPEPEGGYTVSFRRYDENQPDSWQRGSVVGRQVIVSAGTLGSTELLLKCRDEYKTLPRLSQALGTRFSGNGDFLLAGTLDADREIDPGWGPPITAYADFSTANNKITIEDLGLPDPFFWFLEGAMPSGNRLANLARFVMTYLAQSVGLKSGSSRVRDEINSLFAGGKTTRFLPYLGMGTDAADGVLRLRNGSIDIRWSHRRSRLVFREIEEAMRELGRGVNGRYVTSLLWRWPMRKLLTAHPLGGCIVGDSMEQGVVNHYGQVWNYPGLYVADGSVIPSALSVNPSMTIAAVAERTAFWILHDRELLAKDPKTPQNK